MPTINVKGPSGGGGLGGAGGAGAGGPFIPDRQRLAMDAEQRSAAEYRLRKLTNQAGIDSLAAEKREQARSQAAQERFDRQKESAQLKSFKEGQQAEAKALRDKLIEEKRALGAKAKQDREYERLGTARITAQRREDAAYYNRKGMERLAAERAESRGGGGRGGRDHSVLRRALGHAGHGATIGAVIGSLGNGDLGGIAGGLGGAAGGAIGGMLAGELGAVVGAEIGKMARFLVNPVGAIASSAAPAIDMQRSTYALARANGGFTGSSLYNSFSPSNRVASAWMNALGTTPQDAAGSLSAFGGVPGGFNPMGLARSLSTFGASPAFAAMAPGTVEATARQGVGIGATASSNAGVDSYLMKFAPLLEMAMAKGMDQSKLMESVQGSMDTLARAGSVGGIDTSALLDLTARLAQTGTPGGRTGSTAANVAAGVAGITGDVTKSPFVFSMLMSQLPKFGGLKTQAGVEKFVGHGNLDPTAVKRITDAANAGNPVVALQMATALTQGSTKRLGQLLSPVAGLATGNQSYLTPSFLQATTGTSLSDAMALDSANQQAGLGSGSRTSSFVGGMSKIGQAASMPMSDKAKLLAKGVSPELADHFIREGNKNGVDPLILATLATMETSGGDFSKINPNQGKHFNKNGTVDYGMMGINSNSVSYMDSIRAQSDLDSNIDLGATIFKQKMKLSGGDVGKAFSLYNGRGGAADKYGARAMQLYGSASNGGPSADGLGLPGLANQTRTGAGQGELFGANAALNLLAPAANNAASGLDKLTKAAEDFVNFIKIAPRNRSVQP